MTITVKRKVLTLATGAAIFPVLVMLALIIQFQRKVTRQAETELRTLAQQNLEQVARDVYTVCATSNALLQERMSRNLHAAHQVLARVGLKEGAGSSTNRAI